MRSEIEIRKQVEARFRRWALLLLNGGAWIVFAFALFQPAQGGAYVLANTASDVTGIVMAAWLLLVIAHALCVFYVEARAKVVSYAVKRERSRYSDDSTYRPDVRYREDYAQREKPKRERISADGELVDYPNWEWEDEVEYAQRR